MGNIQRKMGNIQVHYAESITENEKEKRIGIGIHFTPGKTNQMSEEEIYRKTLEKLRKVVRDELKK